MHGSKSRRHRQRGGGAEGGLSLASLVLGGAGGGGGGAGSAESSAEAEAEAGVGGERVVARCPFCGPAGLKSRLGGAPTHYPGRPGRKASALGCSSYSRGPPPLRTWRSHVPVPELFMLRLPTPRRLPRAADAARALRVLLLADEERYRAGLDGAEPRLYGVPSSSPRSNVLTFEEVCEFYVQAESVRRFSPSLSRHYALRGSRELSTTPYRHGYFRSVGHVGVWWGCEWLRDEAHLSTHHKQHASTTQIHTCHKSHQPCTCTQGTH